MSRHCKRCEEIDGVTVRMEKGTEFKSPGFRMKKIPYECWECPKCGSRWWGKPIDKKE